MINCPIFNYMVAFRLQAKMDIWILKHIPALVC
jgi:hypothetical protein